MDDDDKKFQQRWEFRRKETDGDTSSDDNRSNASGPPARLATDLVLLENEAASDNPDCQTPDKQTSKAGEKKIKSIKKKKEKICPVKKNTRKTNLKSNEETKVMFNDLRVFSDSLIQELTSARENMFADMRDEMRKLAAARGSKKEPIVKKGRVSKPKNVKINVGPDAVETTKDDVGLRVLATTAHLNLANASDQVVSSSYLTLPTVITKPQFQNPRNHLPFLNNRFAEFRPEERAGSLFGQNYSQTANGVAYPVPLNRGTDNGSNIAGLSYCESSFVDSNRMGPRMNGGGVRLPRGNLAPSDQMLAYINMARKFDGEFVPVRPQELKDGQFYMSSLRNQE